MRDNHVKGDPRSQAYLLPVRLEEWIPSEHPARLTDCFVDSLDIYALGIEEHNDETGRPSYSPWIMLKILLYSYSTGVRSSRRIERMTYENIAVRWLTGNLHPDYRTIARFRSRSRVLLKRLLTETITLYKDVDLDLRGFDGVLYTDGTKVEANASSGRSFSRDGLLRMAERILRETELADAEDDVEFGADGNGERLSPQALSVLKDKIRKAAEKLDGNTGKRAKRLARALDVYEAQAGSNSDKKGRVNVTDSDARFMKHADGRKAPSYNVQVTTDSKGVILGMDVVQDECDNHQLSRMVAKALDNLGVRMEDLSIDDDGIEIRVAADTGYFEIDQLRRLLNKGITPIVKAPDREKAREKRGMFRRDEFKYQPKKEVVICPASKELKYKSIRKMRGKEYMVFQGKRRDCGKCPMRSRCISDKGGDFPKTFMLLKDVEFWERHNRIMRDAENQEIYRRRSQKAELPFAFMKHALGFGRFSLRGKENVKGEQGLMCSVYNLKRIENVIGFKKLLRRLSRRRMCNPMFNHLSVIGIQAEFT
jgi:transposase